MVRCSIQAGKTGLLSLSSAKVMVCFNKNHCNTLQMMLTGPAEILEEDTPVEAMDIADVESMTEDMHDTPLENLDDANGAETCAITELPAPVTEEATAAVPTQPAVLTVTEFLQEHIEPTEARRTAQVQSFLTVDDPTVTVDDPTESEA